MTWLSSSSTQNFFSSTEEPYFLLSLGQGACCSFPSSPLAISTGCLLCLSVKSRCAPRAPSTPPIPALIIGMVIFWFLISCAPHRLINSIRPGTRLCLFTIVCSLSGAWHALNKYHWIEEWLWGSLFHCMPPGIHTSCSPLPLNWAVPVTWFKKKKVQNLLVLGLSLKKAWQLLLLLF